ncbi:putative metallopeptidase [Rhizobium sp. BK591]|uniref:putative metallopeptidase n=1 Tax=Rhizobium sp. BK591 TaxID=2586985 RepID=UPI001FEDF534|nr:putative metallopeptidase [Rhizobium sp. BK591]
MTASRSPRPQPPSNLFDVERLGAFVPAPDLAEWIEATFLDEASPVFNPDHEHLAHAEIGYLWTAVENSRKGKRVVGQCEIGKPQGAMGKWSRARAELQVIEWFGTVPDFIITLDAEYCRHCGDAEFLALLEHELYHAAQERDAFGAPKFNKMTGLPVFTIQGHDVEQFIGVVRRYGADASGVRELVDAARRPPAVARAFIDHACGTCNLRVA